MKFNGLSEESVILQRKKYGVNKLEEERKESFFEKLIGVLKEPMFLLLIVTSGIYFFLGEKTDGLIMLFSICGIISIELIQEWKTGKTIAALKELSSPKVEVIRGGEKKFIDSSELVVGDIMIVNEGDRINADGIILKTSDLSVNESLLTGESQVVWKSLNPDDKNHFKLNYCYAGTLVIQGSATVQVTEVGKNTEYGKIGVSLNEIESEDSPLQKQIRKVIIIFATAALICFIGVVIFTFFNLSDYALKDRIIKSILSGITLAMSMIPEEFPVILTVFLSLGAWRLAKKKSVIRNLSSVETLGSISVLCVDKTGTITENKMEVSTVITSADKFNQILTLACEEETYDPMELALLDYTAKQGMKKEALFKSPLIHDYPFTNELKIMGHVYEIAGNQVLCAKGSPEKILELCDLSNSEKEKIVQEIENLSSKGLRIIAVATKELTSIPSSITDIKMQYLGSVALKDPIRKEVAANIKKCYRAGIKVVMITGDNGDTASSIAHDAGIAVSGIMTGEELKALSDAELKEKIKDINIFARVIPEDKKRIVQAFKSNGEVVAMTGDGVNDAPALKLADIGIAMGKAGSQVSREAADLILLDDNFSTIVDTISDGRRIFDNIKKAVGYILTIHVPIALTALLAPLLGVELNALMLLPIHIVLLELVIDPTCSIVLERCPADKGIMERKPRKVEEGLINTKLAIKSIAQGLVIFGCSFGIYYYTLKTQGNILEARTLGLTTLIIAGVFLVLINSSNRFMVTNLVTFLKDKVLAISLLIIAVGIVISVYTPFSSILKLTTLSFNQLLFVIMLAFLSTIWYEVFKIKYYLKKQS